MRKPRNTTTQFEAYLLDDDRRWLMKYYPEAVEDGYSPKVGVYSPPRDAYTITLPEAAKILGMSRQGAHKLAVERGAFHSCRRIGPPDKPLYLLDVREVKEHAKARGQRG